MTSSHVSDAPSPKRKSTSVIPKDALFELEEKVSRAILTGDTSELNVLGYGEITSVLSCHRPEGSWACKRLPPFPDTEAIERYRRTFDAYLSRLTDAGVSVLPSEIHEVKVDGELPTLWCVQPLMDRRCFLVETIGSADPAESCEIFDLLIERLSKAVGPRLGIDAQASNWVLEHGEPLYLDVTTPLMRDENGRELLDIELFLASLPFALRKATRRFLLGSILDKYYSLRSGLVDFLGNLIKERLEPMLPLLLPRANRVVNPAITEEELTRYYRWDARMWRALMWIRMLDRSWQLRVRRRPYPFLLPGKIDRNTRR